MLRRAGSACKARARLQLLSRSLCRAIEVLSGGRVSTGEALLRAANIECTGCRLFVQALTLSECPRRQVPRSSPSTTQHRGGRSLSRRATAPGRNFWKNPAGMAGRAFGTKNSFAQTCVFFEAVRQSASTAAISDRSWAHASHKYSILRLARCSSARVRGSH